MWFNGNRLAVWDLLNGREPRCTGRDGRWAMEMVLGIYASHLSGRRLEFPLRERRHPLGG